MFAIFQVFQLLAIFKQKILSIQKTVSLVCISTRDLINRSRGCWSCLAVFCSSFQRSFRHMEKRGIHGGRDAHRLEKRRKNTKRDEFTLISINNGWMECKNIFRHKKTSSCTNQRRSCFNRTSWQPDYRSFRLRLAALRPNLSECLPFIKLFNYLLLIC